MSDFELPAAPSAAVDLSRLKSRVDVSRIFLLFINGGGNRYRTAAASGLSVDEVSDLALSEDWHGKLAERTRIAEADSKTTDDINREIARLQAAAQSQRLIDEINGILLHLEKLPKDEKMDYLFEVDRTGKKTPTAKFFTDLAKALETAHGCLYRALADQLPARPNAINPEETGKMLGVGVAQGVATLLAGMKPLKPAKKEPIVIVAK